MDILYHTEDVLALRARYWRLFLYMGIVFTFVGIIVFILLSRTISLACLRENDTMPDCYLTQKLFGLTLREKTIDGLTYARVVENRDGDDDITYRIILETESGVIPLTSYYSSGKNKKSEIVEEITSFVLDSTMRTLRVQQGGTNTLLFPLLFTMTGIVEIFGGVIGRHNIWHFDKVERLTTHKRLGLTGSRITQYALDDMIDATISSRRDSEGDTTYRIELITKSGERIPMTSWYSSGYKKKSETTIILRDFLKGKTSAG